MIGSGVGLNIRSEFFNPPNPVNVPVQGFNNGARLRVVLIPTGGDRFFINLRTPDDIVLHFNPRFDEQTVVNNSTVNGGWQSEDRLPMPFKANNVYTLEFASNNGIISININGNHFADFVERSSSSNVHLIEVGGEVHIHYANVTN